MKKHDEGYVLPLVLVVMIVMCLIATSLMSFSLQNLKSQQASIERMAEKYEAEGIIEIILTKLGGINVSELKDTINGTNNGYVLEVNGISTENEPYVEFTVEKEDQAKVSIKCKLNLIIEDSCIAAFSYAKYEVSNIGGSAE